MIAQLIGGFIAIIVGASLLGPAADTIYTATNRWSCNNSDCTLAQCGNSNATGCGDYNSTLVLNSTNVTSWAKIVTSLTVGFFALALMGTGVAVLYGVLKEAGVF